MKDVETKKMILHCNIVVWIENGFLLVPVLFSVSRLLADHLHIHEIIHFKDLII